MKSMSAAVALALAFAAGALRTPAQADYRSGTSTFPSGNTFSVTFATPMPDSDYSVSVQPSNTPAGFTSTNVCTYLDVVAKSAAGFQVTLRKCHSPGNLVNATNLSFDWIALENPCVEAPGMAFVAGLSAYTSAVASMTDTLVDFSTDCSGASTHAVYQEVPGNFYEHCDVVSFQSVGASNQYLPAGSCTPFRGQSFPWVAAIGSDHGGPSMTSSAGGLNYSGYDALEADFTGTYRAVGIAVSGLPQGGTLQVYGPSGAMTHTYDLPANTSPAFYGVVGACIRSVRIVPATQCNLPLTTSSWGTTAIHFAR